MEEQARYVRRPMRPWRESSLADRLKVVQEQIKLNDEKPTDPNWEMRDTVLRDRESKLLVEIKNAAA